MGRKTATFVKCDEASCNVHAEIGDGTGEAPEGWYLVLCSVVNQKVGYAYDRGSGFEFHSLRCMERWAKERRQYQENGHKPNRFGRIPVEEITRRQDAVMDAFTGKPEQTLSIADLCEATGMPKHQVDTGLHALLSAGIVTMTEGRRGPIPSRYKVV